MKKRQGRVAHLLQHALTLHPALALQRQHQQHAPQRKRQQGRQCRPRQTETLPLPHPENQQRVEHQIEQAGDHHHQTREAGIAVGPEQAVAKIHHTAHPHGRQLQGPIGANQRLDFRRRPQQGEHRGLYQPQQPHQQPLEHATADQHQRPQPVGFGLLAGADGA